LNRSGKGSARSTSNKAGDARRRGVLLVLSGPSGVGKSTLCRRLLRSVPGLEFSISFTTRPPRPGEREGADYRFVSESEFRRLRKQSRFLEWAQVDGEFYGTSKDGAEQALRRGEDVLLDIDTQGAEQVRKRFRDAVLIFVLPPHPASLRARHRRRGTDPRVRERRLKLARQEVLRSKRYDYLVFNDRLETAFQDLKGIILAERCRSKRQLPRARKVLQAFRKVASG
jgi:guanylate kinase